MLISQPPADDDLYEASMYHYTWGARYVRGRTNHQSHGTGINDLTSTSNTFENRENTCRPCRLNLSKKAGDLKLLDGTLVTSKLNDVMRDLIGTMRNAIQRLDTLDYNRGGSTRNQNAIFDVKPASCVNLFAPRATSFIHHPLFCHGALQN